MPDTGEARPCYRVRASCMTGRCAAAGHFVRNADRHRRGTPILPERETIAAGGIDFDAVRDRHLSGMPSAAMMQAAKRWLSWPAGRERFDRGGA
ncbi:hypothetical protein [Burkholderia plantarii]|uniref:hypothetical protein n=1 Tax=Burkholderia plantarii TaxID=41899 RepID=UPI0018DB711F|nr:hypothetical protein [Burkholderia plantarii]MBI0329044.1 hypothetical protein [Burkholderia plantarii]